MTEQSLDIIIFLSNSVGVAPQKITIDTSLRDDLGVDGEDAEELMINYSNEFHVDLSNFVFKRHFSSEFQESFFDLFSALFCRSNFEPILVRDLIASAELGRWIKG